MPHNARTQNNEKINDNINVNISEVQKNPSQSESCLLVSGGCPGLKNLIKMFLCIFTITIYPLSTKALYELLIQYKHIS